MKAEAGAQIMGFCGKYGISNATECSLKAKYHDMEIREFKRLRHLEDEN